MNNVNGADTIAAIATPPGRGAIGVVRISGRDAVKVLSRVFHPAKAAREWVSHRLEYGKVKHNGIVVDEVMAAVMLAPRSYTMEDTAEIYAHGGGESLRAVLNAVLQSGARPAQPGEFTRLAFLNGRIDLAQAEAVMDVINAKTDAARAAGMRQLGGGLSGKIAGFRDVILKWLAHIELSIDYPEHEAEAMNRELILNESAALLAEMEKLLSTANTGRILTEGLRTAIIGRPNVGKSSLLNAILAEDRAIVTDIPGTTRDVLTELVRVGGVPLNLSDTAGIRETDDPIERLGAEKAAGLAETSELVLFVADSSEPPTDEDALIMERIKDKNVIVVLNKCDKEIAGGWEGQNGIRVSAKHRTGLDLLYAAIKEKCAAGTQGYADEEDIITRERHAWLITRAVESVKAAARELAAGTPEDLVSVNLREAYGLLGEVTGEEVGDDVADRIFSEFCVGK